MIPIFRSPCKRQIAFRCFWPTGEPAPSRLLTQAGAAWPLRLRRRRFARWVIILAAGRSICWLPSGHRLGPVATRWVLPFASGSSTPRRAEKFLRLGFWRPRSVSRTILLRRTSRADPAVATGSSTCGQPPVRSCQQLECHRIRCLSQSWMASHSDVFCSYRRDGAPAGRMAAAIRGVPRQRSLLPSGAVLLTVPCRPSPGSPVGRRERSFRAARVRI